MRRLAVIASVLVFAGVVVQAQGQQPAPAPANLKVLPKTTTRQEVVQIMRGFTRGLGVRCQHCHVGEGNDLSKFDFASDAKPQKEIARAMMTMLMGVNKQLAGVTVPPPPAVEGAPPAPAAAAASGGAKVTCFTCHRGALKPLTAPPPAEGRGGGGLLKF